MKRNGAHRASIAPRPPDEVRPLWSVMIPTFNCARYLTETIRSVLAQDPGPEEMQIEVVDDASSLDDPEVVTHAVGQGRVLFHRQPNNVGHTRNFETCLNRARGRLVHLLHGDDRVEPGFYAAMERAFVAAPAIGAAFCRNRYIDADSLELSVEDAVQDEAGVLANAVETLADQQRIMTPSIVVRREVYERLGGFDDRLRCSEDWEMWVRVAADYPIWYEPQVLAAYRMHENSNTGRHFRLARELDYTRQAIEIFSDYLPSQTARAIASRARATYAGVALSNARRLGQAGDLRGMGAHLAAALRLSPAPGTAIRALGVALPRPWRKEARTG
jgi:glycosyltransferase involved in cell wall biosynthesis